MNPGFLLQKNLKIFEKICENLLTNYPTCGIIYTTKGKDKFPKQEKHEIKIRGAKQ